MRYPKTYPDPLKRVLERAQGPTRLARLLGVTPSAVTNWHVVPPRHLLRIERELGIPAAEVRPDLSEAQAA